MSESNETIIALQARVENLEARVASLHQRADKVMPTDNHLRTQLLEATMIRLKAVDGGEPRVSMCAHETGAWITLFDSQARARLILKVDDDEEEESAEFSVELFGISEAGERQTALRLGLNDNNGAVEVHTSQGKPAALVKGMGESGGVIGVVDEEGRISALLRHQDEGGQLLLFRSPLQQSVTLHAAPQGGMLSLAKAGDVPRVILASVDDGAFLMLNKDQGEGGCGVRIAANEQLAIIAAHDNESSHASTLSATPGRAFIDVERGARDAKVQAFQVTTLDEGNIMQLRRPDGSSGVGINTSPASALITGEDERGNQRFMLIAGETSNGLSLAGENGHAESLNLLADTKARLVLSNAGSPVVVVDVEENGGRVAVLGPEAEPRQISMRALADSAGIGISAMGGEQTAALWSDNAGGHCTLSSAQGTPGVRLHTDEAGGRVVVAGDSGSPRVGMGVMEDKGQIFVMALGGDPVAIISSDEDGGQLTLFDDEGNRALTLPDDATLL